MTLPVGHYRTKFRSYGMVVWPMKGRIIIDGREYDVTFGEQWHESPTPEREQAAERAVVDAFDGYDGW